MRSVLSRPHAPVDARSTALGPCNKRPVHPDELVNEIVDALLVCAVDSIRSLATIKILGKDLLEVPVEFLGALIL